MDTYYLYGPYVAYTYFLLQTVIIWLVLLNLLISIVGDTFGTVNDNKANIMYKDMVQMIIENQFLETEADQAELNKHKYLLFVVPEDQEIEQNELLEMKFQEHKHYL